MHVITASAAPKFDLSGVEFTGYAAPSRGSDDLCTWQITVSFMITSGELRLHPDGPVQAAGDCVIVPAGEPIQVINPGAEAATAHVVIRAGFTATMTDGTAIGTPPWAQ